MQNQKLRQKLVLGKKKREVERLLLPMLQLLMHQEVSMGLQEVLLLSLKARLEA